MKLIRGALPFLFRLLLSVAAGVGLWAAGAPRSWWVCALIGVALLWFTVYRATWPRAFFWGFVAGFVFFYLHCDWAVTASGLLAARVVLAGIEAVFIGVVTALWAGIWRFRRVHHAGVMTLAALGASALVWVGSEVLRSMLPFGGLPWGLLGYLLVDSPLVHLAPLGSTELVGAAGVVCAISGALAVRNAVTIHPFRTLKAAVLCIAVVLIPLLVPLHAPASGQLKVAVVQGNAPHLGSVPDSAWSTITTENQVQAAQSVLKEHPDLFVLPESTSDYDYRVEQYPHDLIMGLARDAGVPLLLGTQRYFTEHGRQLRTNDYVVQYPDGSLPAVEDTYSKQHPVPFGEYVPLRNVVEKLTAKIEEISIDMVAGEKPAQLAVHLPDRDLKVAVPICFEVAYSAIVSQGAASSELLVVPTSNVTFGYSSEALEQFAITKFRAIENGRTAIQVSTMGTSGVVTPNGTVQYQTGLFERDARVVTVPLYRHVTPAASSYQLRMVIVLMGSIAASLWGIWGLCRSPAR
ncbi:MAG: apolipoprotein N-acyltransferase [Actinomycetaceae bacterium]|nr:apolipoprotein N-acyltransferase [Actinomycetaceae bacterium]